MNNKNNHRIICKSKDEKEKRDIKIDARRRSVNKNDAKKPFAAKASDNHASETHVTGVYTCVGADIISGGTTVNLLKFG